MSPVLGQFLLEHKARQECFLVEIFLRPELEDTTCPLE
jgi:hypothetical protein